MKEFFTAVGDAAKEQIIRMTYWQLLVLIVLVIFAIAAAHHYFP